MSLQFGKPVSGASFLGRAKEIARITEHLNSGQSCILIAPRRYGKTSIMKQVQQNLSKNITPNIIGFIHIDIMRFYELDELSFEIMRQLFDIFKVSGIVEKGKKLLSSSLRTVVKILAGTKIGSDKLGLSLELSALADVLEEKDSMKIFQHTLEMIENFCKKSDKKILVFIDEFGEIGKLWKLEEILKIMRSIAQLQTNTTYVFAGSQQSVMNNIFADKKSPFYRFGDILNIPPFTVSDYKDYAITYFKTYNLTITDESIQMIQSCTNGIPYYVIRLLSDTLSNCKLAKINKITPFRILREASEIARKESSYFDSEIEKFGRKKNFVTVLTSIANKKNPYDIESVQRQNVLKILKELLESGVINKSRNNEYLMSDPFLRRHITKNF